MERIRRLQGRIRHYSWGSRHRLAALQGRPFPTPEPEAELWFGAHLLAPALVESDEGRVPLDAWIARGPERALGPRVSRRFGAKLPFLVKLLAVELPLSIQVHPDALWGDLRPHLEEIGIDIEETEELDLLETVRDQDRNAATVQRILSHGFPPRPRARSDQIESI